MKLSAPKFSLASRSIGRIAVAATVLAVSTYLLLTSRREPSFPYIPPGSYTGTLTLSTKPNATLANTTPKGENLASENSTVDNSTVANSALPENSSPSSTSSRAPEDGTAQELTIYAERLGNANSILFVVFSPDWKPQVLSLRPLSPSAGSDSPVKPLLLRQGDFSLMLTGSQSGSTFSGEVDPGNEYLGQWSLRPLSADELRQSKKVSLPNMDTKEWLIKRLEQFQLETELQRLQSEQRDQNEKVTRLERFLTNGEVLKDRSETRRSEISDELNKLSASRKKSTTELRSAMDDLGMLQRATERGQAVELARRIARRENKWFAVKWGDVQENELTEDQLAERDKIDPVKLQVAAKRAYEIEHLRQTIADERAKLEQIEREARQAVETPLDIQQLPPATQPRNRPPSRRPVPSLEEEDRPWWRVWDSFSG